MGRSIFDRELVSRSIGETEAIAADLYRSIEKSAVIALYGPLGAGKTCFVRGVAAAAGVNPEEVNSPSFTLINEYPGGKRPIYHFDLYRMADPSEFYSIGGEDYLEREGIILIEWAENGGEFIPRDRIEVRLAIVDEDRRRIYISRRKM